MFDVRWHQNENGEYDFRVKDRGNHKILAASHQGYVDIMEMLDTASLFGDVRKEGDDVISRTASVKTPTQEQLDTLALEVSARDIEIERLRGLIESFANAEVGSTEALMAEAGPGEPVNE